MMARVSFSRVALLSLLVALEDGLVAPFSLTNTRPVGPARPRARVVFVVADSKSRLSRPLAAAYSEDDTDDAFFTALDSRPVLLFDGVCALCNGFVTFLLDNDAKPPGRLRFAALQSEAGRALLERSGRAPDDHSSMVVVTRRAAHAKSDAVLAIAETLSWNSPVAAAAMKALASLVRVFLPKPLRDAAMNAVAEHRYGVFGESDECRVSDDRFSDRFVFAGSDLLHDDEDDDIVVGGGAAADYLDPWSPFSVVGGDRAWSLPAVDEGYYHHPHPHPHPHHHHHHHLGEAEEEAPFVALDVSLDAWRGPPPGETTTLVQQKPASARLDDDFLLQEAELPDSASATLPEEETLQSVVRI